MSESVEADTFDILVSVDVQDGRVWGPGLGGVLVECSLSAVQQAHALSDSLSVLPVWCGAHSPEVFCPLGMTLSMPCITLCCCLPAC
jgi:hypothetical protein